MYSMYNVVGAVEESRQGQEASRAAEGGDREQGLFIKGSVGGTVAKDL